jgi:hypothetical protein
VIVGGNMSSNQQTTAGIHSKIGTHSGGAHLKVLDISALLGFPASIFSANNFACNSAFF